MKEAISCGGVVIHRGKVLTLYKNYKNKYEGWVLPKGTVEKNETFEQTALREVREESGVNARIIMYIGKSAYTFNSNNGIVDKEVHWYLMSAESFYNMRAACAARASRSALTACCAVEKNSEKGWHFVSRYAEADPVTPDSPRRGRRERRVPRGTPPELPTRPCNSAERSEERRVGKECRSRWSPYH